MNDVAYVIASGSYSDYHVDGVFLDKALAEAFIEMHGGDDSEYGIEEFPVNPLADIIRERRQTWLVRMSWEGDVLAVTTHGPPLSGYDPIEWNPYGKYWTRILIADDKEHAIKSTNEHRAQAIASGTPRDVIQYFAWLRDQGQQQGNSAR